MLGKNEGSQNSRKPAKNTSKPKDFFLKQGRNDNTTESRSQKTEEEVPNEMKFMED